MQRFKLLFAALVTCAALPAHAALVVFTGTDDSVSTFAQMVNSQAAAAAFGAATPGSTLITFEGSLPAGVSIGGDVSLTNNSGCGALCGFNTTPGGQNFLLVDSQDPANSFLVAAFAFVNPVDAFGFYVTGLQTNVAGAEMLVFTDGSSQQIDVPATIDGGGAFIGFTDFGKSIALVLYISSTDIVAIDDVRFHVQGSIPEPGSLPLLALALTALAVSRRRR